MQRESQLECKLPSLMCMMFFAIYFPLHFMFPLQSRQVHTDASVTPERTADCNKTLLSMMPDP